MNNRIGYVVGSHVIYNHKALTILLESLIGLNQVDPACVVVAVNGARREHRFRESGVHFYFGTKEIGCHLAPLVNYQLGRELGIDYWFYLNCTSRCGPRFKDLVESGYDPEADATVAGLLLSLSSTGGVDGRAVNDLAMYRYDYLMANRDKINSMETMSIPQAIEFEGTLYAHAPRQAHYPNLSYTISPEAEDIYGTGTLRRTEYFPAIDWFRFKKNWGQMPPGYDPAGM